MLPVPMQLQVDRKAEPYFEAGRALSNERLGQLDLMLSTVSSGTLRVILPARGTSSLSLGMKLGE